MTLDGRPERLQGLGPEHKRSRSQSGSVPHSQRCCAHACGSRSPHPTSIYAPQAAVFGPPPGQRWSVLGRWSWGRGLSRSELEAIRAENSGVQVPGTWSGRRVWAPRGHNPFVPWTPREDGETG